MKKEVRYCLYCNTRIYQSTIETDKAYSNRKFCSVSCASRDRWKGHEKYCKACGKLMRNHKNRYCSVECKRWAFKNKRKNVIGQTKGTLDIIGEFIDNLGKHYERRFMCKCTVCNKECIKGYSYLICYKKPLCPHCKAEKKELENGNKASI